ncbi:hypothetical protein [uncultured Devosia sp.]|uniref:hypothetical protein n=1 Tax=uncultured Devosia sp. TaxID=211434 RepID=UPI0035CB1D8D
MPDPDKKETLEATLLRLASPNNSPRDMLREARKLHPKASKKQIIRAAFSSLIGVADHDIERSQALQNFALTGRGPEEQ